MKTPHAPKSRLSEKRRFAALVTIAAAAVPGLSYAQNSSDALSRPAAGPSGSSPAAPTVSAAGSAAPTPAAGSSATSGTSSAAQQPKSSAGVVTEGSTSASADGKQRDAEAQAAVTALEAQAASHAVEEASAEPKINIYGFADFTYMHTLNSYPWAAPAPSFAIGNLNVYMRSDLGENLRSLVEVRLLYLPNGATSYSSSGTLSRTDTSAADYSDVDRPVQWGGVSIQRAWVEYSAHQLLTVRAGQWLTPYGIWNVDHGSPVVIGVRRPYIVGEALFPQSQTGLEAYGNYYLGGNKLGYHVTLSNGRGPIDTYRDLDNNKALGVRAFWTNESPIGSLTIGASGYRGQYTNGTVAWKVDPGGGMRYDYPVTSRYDELSLGADLKFERGGLLVQGEIVMNDIAYDDAYRPASQSFSPDVPNGRTPDYRRWGYYGLVGYRFPFLGIMPFFGTEYYWVGMQSFAPNSRAFWGGLNVRPFPRLVLKAQYTQWDFPTNAPGMGKVEGFKGLDFQVAWSF